MDSLSFSIGWQYLLNRRRQFVFSVMGVVMGVAFLIGIASMMRGMHDYFIKTLVDVAPHVKVMDEFRTSEQQPVFAEFPENTIELRGIKPKEELRGIRSADAIMETLSQRSDLAASPTLQGEVFLRYGGKDIAALLTGIKPELERHASNLERDMVTGSLNSLQTNANGIILGEELARKLAIRPGASLSVASPAGIVKKMKVVGLFNTGVTEVDAATAYAMLKKVQVLHNKENRINRINIRMQDVNRATTLARDIEDRYGYRTESWQETFANIFEMFVIENAIMYSTVGAIMLVAGFGIFNIISTAVTEKRHDIAILKSIGFSQKDIRQIFVFQGLIIGLAGTLVGWLLGAILIELLASITFNMGDEVDMPIRFDGLPVYRSIWLYIASGVMAVIASMVSAYIPARKAAAVYPVDIIRGTS